MMLKEHPSERRQQLQKIPLNLKLFMKPGPGHHISESASYTFDYT